MKRVLVTGGAGYIGSLVSHQLLQDGYDVHIIDNLDTGHFSSVPSNAKFYDGDLTNLDFVRTTFNAVKPESVIHLAAKASVPESVQKPILYFQNNVGGSHNLLQCIREFEVNKLIFSSTAAVYSGKGASKPISTDETPDPQNPYGLSKLVIEESISWLCKTSYLRAVALRYFNVAGASLDSKFGQRTKGSGHLLKKVAEYLVGKETTLKVFGNDYPTKDGTCVRDYIHVLDLVDVHIQCLKAISTTDKMWAGFNRFNCGYGNGSSILDVFSAVEDVIGKKLTYSFGPRRDGDPAYLVADPTKLNQLLSWSPKFNDLKLICKTAIDFEKHIHQGNIV